MATCQLDARVGEVRDEVEASRYGFAFVVTRTGVLLGRLRRAALEDRADPAAEDVMEPGPSTIRPDVRLAPLAQRMRSRMLTSLPITTPEGRLLGLARRDDVEAALDAQSSTRERPPAPQHTSVICQRVSRNHAPTGQILSDDGWPYASSLPIDANDPGRYHALFGRDSLIYSLQVMPEQPDVARATLRVLAALQGQREDPETDEGQGKIVHEYRPQADPRFVEMGWPVRDGELRYYGSADSTSWFLVVLAALGDSALDDELSACWRAASAWVERALERGRGLVRHGPRQAQGGLVQQGWRDTSDPLLSYGGGIVDADGHVPEPPLADADTQAVTVAALRATARLSGDERWRSIADRTAEHIAAAFTPQTIAVDGDDRRVPGPGSQLGWLLWADALPTSERAVYAERLCRPDILTDFGLRTLSSEHPQFDPRAYHRGAVWPFDSWLGWGGLRAAGRTADAERVRRGVLAAVERLGDAPELYAVNARGPEPIPIANRVQAWTVGARFALEQGWDGRLTP